MFMCLYHVRATDPKLANRVFALRQVVSIIINEFNLHVWSGTAGIREPFVRGYSKNGDDFNLPFRRLIEHV